jgi:hypothetical protein
MNDRVRMDRRTFLARLGVGTISAASAICTFDVERIRRDYDYRWPA